MGPGACQLLSVDQEGSGYYTACAGLCAAKRSRTLGLPEPASAKLCAFCQITATRSAALASAAKSALRCEQLNLSGRTHRGVRPPVLGHICLAARVHRARTYVQMITRLR